MNIDSAEISQTVHRLIKQDYSKPPQDVIQQQYAKVYGSVIDINGIGERIVVACPFCYRVHVHEASRHPISTFIPPVYHHDHSHKKDAEESHDSMDSTNRVTWETDRVAPCKMGTYHIVGSE